MNAPSEFLREPMTDELVWLFISEGCNANEIAAYGGITRSAAVAWMAHVHRAFASARPVETLTLRREAA